MDALDAAWWHRPGRLQALDHDECEELLASRRVGRIAYVAPTGPRVVPMNHVVERGSVLVATVPTSELVQRALGSAVAFEVDDLDEYYEAGWSVLATGTLELHPAQEDAFTLDRLPTSWVADRQVVLRLAWTSLSGRRLVAG